MADNYLENKMQELREGRFFRRSAPSAYKPQKGYIATRFPSMKVLVTGGANGIGRAIVESYLKADCKVAVFDKDAEKGELLARNEGVRFYNVDVADAEALEKSFLNLLEAWRDIDVIVNNAGIGNFRPLTEGTPDYFDHVLNVNLRPAYILARLWALHREKFPSVSDFGGRMVLIASSRHIQSEPGTEAYSASKGALTSLTHSLMMSLSRYRITVNSISPGWIHTGDESELKEIDKFQHPSRRVGKPEDIARVCVFLSLPTNDFINGTDIIVDGGMTRKMIYVES